MQCSMSYHHFPSIEETTRILAYFLKPGGVLLVSDMLRPDSTNGEQPSESLFPEEFHHIVPHKEVFKEADIRKAYDFAGLSQFEFIPDVTSSIFHTKIFLAKGTKV
jgi:SAM-dependent methyltransferase